MTGRLTGQLHSELCNICWKNWRTSIKINTNESIGLYTRFSPKLSAVPKDPSPVKSAPSPVMTTFTAIHNHVAPQSESLTSIIINITPIEILLVIRWLNTKAPYTNRLQKLHTIGEASIRRIKSCDFPLPGRFPFAFVPVWILQLQGKRTYQWSVPKNHVRTWGTTLLNQCYCLEVCAVSLTYYLVAPSVWIYQLYPRKEQTQQEHLHWTFEQTISPKSICKTSGSK